MIADVIDNDSWRIWPQGREELMLDKQIYRNLPEVNVEDLATMRANYEQVAEIVGTFPVMRPGMVAVDRRRSRVRRARRRDRAALGQLRLAGGASRRVGPARRRVTSCSSSRSSKRRSRARSSSRWARATERWRRCSSTRARRRCSSSRDCRRQPGRDAVREAFGLEDTVLFGRMLLMQANARSAVLHADASLHAAGGAGSPGSVALAAPDDALRDDELRTSSRGSGATDDAELHAFDAQWSEHCTYKSSRHHSAPLADRRSDRRARSG